MIHSVLAVIPARGGSKGIPGKNLIPLCGKPLIAYSIESARASKLITRLIVSTDSPEIAEVARRWGAEVPFLRPASLATDEALSVDVVKHAIVQMKQLFDLEFEYALLLQPTTPLRSAQDIDSALSQLFKSGADSTVSLVDVGAHHPSRMYHIEDGNLVGVMKEGVAMRPRQELPAVYIRSGDIYACRTEKLLSSGSFLERETLPFVMNPDRAVNIDSYRDLAIAESIIGNQR